jgi:Fructose-bisphosphate aldolase class-I
MTESAIELISRPAGPPDQGGYDNGTIGEDPHFMTSHDLELVATTLVTNGKGILAADETVPTLTRRFDALGIQSTEQSRRTYREMLFTAPGALEFISGSSCRMRPSVKGAPAARHSPRFSRIRASFRGSRLIPVRGRSPAFPAKQ